MRRIFKYQLAVTDEQAIEMPMHSKILCVQVQHGIPCLWAEVEDTEKLVPRLIVTKGTGQPFLSDRSFKYLGTYQCGDLVFHVFY